MPLFVDTELLRVAAKWPADLVLAIEDMQMAVRHIAVTPAVARQLVGDHVAPLNPALGLEHVFAAGWISWDQFRTVGTVVEVKSMSWLDTCIGAALTEIPEWAANRKLTQRTSIYCEYCWRHVMRDRRFCPYHDPQINQAGYRVARRMIFAKAGAGQTANRFVDEIVKMRREDIEKKALKGWGDVVQGNYSLISWLHEYRPQLYRVLGLKDFTDTLDISELISLLDRTQQGDESQAMVTQRQELHAHLSNYPDEITGLLRRAEAWHRLHNHYRQGHPHGGLRRGAGWPKGRARKLC